MGQTVLLNDYENIYWSMVREYHLKPELSHFLAAVRKVRTFFLCTTIEHNHFSRGENGERSIHNLVSHNG